MENNLLPSNRSCVTAGASRQRETTNTVENFEVAISFEGEAGLLSNYKNCKKNPGHKEFIPIKDFNKNHLPARYRYQDFEDFVKALADITGRVSHSYISPDRPETYPDSEIRFSLYEYRGKHMPVTGTVRISDVERFTEDENSKCPCDDCKENKTHHVVWGSVKVQTANHVVFDQTEAQNTKCQLFDKDNKKVCEFNKVSIWRNNIGDDFCELTAALYDDDILTNLDKNVKHFYKLQDEIKLKYFPRSSWQHPLIENVTSKLNTEVTFGQGLNKLVALGQGDNRATVPDDSSEFENINEEDNLEKNVKERMWIDLEELNLQHLPEPYRHWEILEFIRVHADLTVKFSVSQVSDVRPEGLRHADQVGISGTGYINKVVPYQESDGFLCICKICTLSSSSRTSWGKIVVETTRDGLYQQNVADCCTCQIFFGKSAFKCFFTKLEMNIEPPDLVHNLTIILHDMKLLKELQDLVDRRNKLCQTICKKFSGFQSFIFSKTDPRNLAIVVSHPHGQDKKVTVGDLVERINMGTELRLSFSTEYIYNAHTCSGSSGAQVFFFQNMDTFFEPLHSRGNYNNFNISCLRWDLPPM